MGSEPWIPWTYCGLAHDSELFHISCQSDPETPAASYSNVSGRTDCFECAPYPVGCEWGCQRPAKPRRPVSKLNNIANTSALTHMDSVLSSVLGHVGDIGPSESVCTIVWLKIMFTKPLGPYPLRFQLISSLSKKRRLTIDFDGTDQSNPTCGGVFSSIAHRTRYTITFRFKQDKVQTTTKEGILDEEGFQSRLSRVYDDGLSMRCTWWEDSLGGVQRLKKLPSLYQKRKSKKNVVSG